MLSNKIKLRLRKQQYRIIGSHSSVKICEWTKKSLREQDFCYKEKFYGIKSHQCCQMTPSLICCNSCIFCWRDTSMLTNKELKSKIDEPQEIIKGCIEKQRELLNGFKGNNKVNMIKFKEAQEPMFFAISLTGEPTLYPRLGEMISELYKQKKCSFLVTNGMFPKNIEKLYRLPTQLYLSLDAPTKQIYRKVDRPLFKDYWERLNKTLELLPSLDTRITLRLTLIKGLNMSNIEEYAKLIKKADPLFIELKAYMLVGSSRKILKKENMPWHYEIVDFARKLESLTDNKLIDEKVNSRVVLMMKEDFKGRIIKLDYS
jgi:tRNA wybutosine-synthesizing protein 1